MGALKKLFSKSFYNHRAYIRFWDRLPLKSDAVLLESQKGNALGGNIAAILRSLLTEPEFSGYKIYITVTASSEKLLPLQWRNEDRNGRVKTVRFASRKYFRILASAKYLINDVSFTEGFIKKAGQVYLNTWHGTPLKTLGAASAADRYLIGNVQKNFLSADILLFQNEYSKDKIIRDYGLENFAKGRYSISGYPRNEVFFDSGLRERLRTAYAFGESLVCAYLPTWRGGDSHEELNGLLSELDRRLDGSVLFFVKLHPLAAEKVDFSAFSSVRPLPCDIPLYDFLQATDMLVTDYSSVLFDYVLSGRETVLFNYDEESYSDKRGFYFDPGELPFKKVKTAGELAGLLNGAASDRDCGLGSCGAENYADFLKKFCPFDGQGVTKKLLQDIFSGRYRSYPGIAHNGKKDVVIFCGDFIKNGITTATVNLLNGLDCSEFNYRVLYQIKPGGHEKDIESVPESIPMLGCVPLMSAGLFELAAVKLWEKTGLFPYGRVKKIYERIGAREYTRIFGDAEADMAVHFTGYGTEYMELLASGGRPFAVFVHNDMNLETRKAGVTPARLLADIYAHADCVACVSDSVRAAVLKLISKYRAAGEGAADDMRQFCVIPNLIGEERIRRLAAEPLRFDEATAATLAGESLSLEQTKAFLKKGRIFINVGRFAAQKAQTTLVEAFEKTAELYQDARLIILGSYGPLYEKVLEAAGASKYSDRILVIRYLSNPYPLIAAADCFVLSSLYEGLPVVFTEADILGLPCISTDFESSRKFLADKGGMLTGQGADELARGMSSFLGGEHIAKLGMDYREFDRSALQAFNTMIADNIE